MRTPWGIASRCSLCASVKNAEENFDDRTRKTGICEMLHKEIQPFKSKKYRECEYAVNNGVGIFFRGIRLWSGVTFLRDIAYTDDRSVMRNVLSGSGHWTNCPLFGCRPVAGRTALAVSAGLAACAGADRSRVVPASLLTGGGRNDEGCCMEESEIFERHFEQAVSYHLKAGSCKKCIRRKRAVWQKAVPSVFQFSLNFQIVHN